MLKRIVLFLLTNLAITLTISIVLAILTATGVIDLRRDTQTLLAIYCLLYGFGAAFISLLLSRIVAKWSTGARVIGADSRDPEEAWLYNTVTTLARQANLPMPEVAVYESPEVNAFATGPSKKRSLVAVSRGILRSMTRDELSGVIGHELTHVANGDMVTMTLIQGVVNAFVLYVSHVVAMLVRGILSPRDGASRQPNFLALIASQLVFMASQIVLSLLGSLIVAGFSRRREFRADKGGAALVGRGAMLAALRRLVATEERVDTQHASLASFKIAGGRSWLQLFASHPPLPERIAALEQSA